MAQHRAAAGIEHAHTAMTVRITHEANTVRIDGRLEGEAVTELDRVCREVSGGLVLDLSALLSADEIGLAALRALLAGGATVTGASPYIQLLLKGASA